LKRTLVISDIHGCLDQLNDLITMVQFNHQEDTLILLGDYVDRGPKSKDVVEQVMYMVQELGVIALRGNHDQRFVDILLREDVSQEQGFIAHGGLETLKSYSNVDGLSWLETRELIKLNYQEHLSFLDNLPYYHEDNNHIYVHAGLNPDYEDWRGQPVSDFLWIREKFIRHKTNATKVVVFGHTRTIDIHGKSNIWFSDDKIGIDGGSAHGWQLNCLEIKEGGIYHEHHIVEKYKISPVAQHS
jgi:serine/threonine protein phosphatase 1